MRLADFILENSEPVLAEWEAFARSIWPGVGIDTDPRELRDHAADILLATARDMKSVQTDTEQSDKSKGEGSTGKASDRVDQASDVHATSRVRSGFDLMAVVAEYRALRASVIRLWRESVPAPDRRDIDDLTRFHESIDQSLIEAVRSYTQHIDRSRQMFLAILGHDLRGPLGSMSMSAELLRRSGQLDDDASATALQIVASATAMGQMIGDLLDFAASGLGATIPIAPARMDLNVLCQAVVDEMAAAHPERPVRFRPEGDLTGTWDGGRLRQVLSNLLGNAVQHGANGTPIELAATGHAAEARISVHNQGPPIPRGALPTIFDPLVRAQPPDTRRRRRAGSIGLGLYIAREVVVAHGGDIAVESSAEGGTVFTVRLPRKAATRP